MAGVKSAEIVWRGETLLIAQAWTWSYHTVNCANLPWLWGCCLSQVKSCNDCFNARLGLHETACCGTMRL